MKKINRVNQAFVSCSTILKLSHCSEFLKHLEKILISKEIIKCKIEAIQYEEVFGAIKISWINYDKTNSTCSIIKKLFEREFPHLSNDIYHVAPHLIIQRLLVHQRNIEILTRSTLFNKEANKLQIYNRNNLDFDGLIILFCLFNDSLKDSLLKLFEMKTKEPDFEDYMRFGIHLGGNAISKSFAFHQIKIRSIYAKNKINIKKYRDDENGRHILMESPKNLSNMDQFANYIIKLVLDNCN